MWRYFAGVSPLPPSKKMKTSEEKLKIQRLYEISKRKRAFNPNWKVGHPCPWLGIVLVDEELGYSTSDATSTSSHASMMICTMCRTAGKIDPTILAKNSFASGCQSFKLESIKIHEASNKHIIAKEIVKSIEALEKQPTRKMLTILRKDDIEKLSRLFRTCHALAMKNRPFSDFVLLIQNLVHHLHQLQQIQSQWIRQLQWLALRHQQLYEPVH
jgi:hypothetical protein